MEEIEKLMQEIEELIERIERIERTIFKDIGEKEDQN